MEGKEERKGGKEEERKEGKKGGKEAWENEQVSSLISRMLLSLPLSFPSSFFILECPALIVWGFPVITTDRPAHPIPENVPFGSMIKTSLKSQGQTWVKPKTGDPPSVESLSKPHNALCDALFLSHM